MRSLISCCILIGTLPASSASAQPEWWMEAGVTNGQMADDYAAANLGQLKYMAARAAAALDMRTPAGAGGPITALVAGWEQPATPGIERDDYAAATAGQLKQVARLFYQRLVLLGQEAGFPARPYPWSGAGTAADDWAVINLGQLKYAFSFEIAAHDWSGDADRDLIPDDWELSWLGGVSATPGGDADGDTLGNLAEYLLWQISANPDPSSIATAVTSQSLGLVVFSP